MIDNAITSMTDTVEGIIGEKAELVGAVVGTEVGCIEDAPLGVLLGGFDGEGDGADGSGDGTADGILEFPLQNSNDPMKKL